MLSAARIACVLPVAGVLLTGTGNAFPLQTDLSSDGPVFPAVLEICTQNHEGFDGYGAVLSEKGWTRIGISDLTEDQRWNLALPELAAAIELGSKSDTQPIVGQRQIDVLLATAPEYVQFFERSETAERQTMYLILGPDRVVSCVVTSTFERETLWLGDLRARQDLTEALFDVDPDVPGAALDSLRTGEYALLMTEASQFSAGFARVSMRSEEVARLGITNDIALSVLAIIHEGK